MRNEPKKYSRRHMMALTAKAAAAGVITTSIPASVLAATTGQVLAPGRALILMRFAGGNDSFNTIVPLTGWTGPTAASFTPNTDYAVYYNRRPTIRLDPTTLIAKTSQYGFHPALAPLMTAWSGGDMAITMGIGYNGKPEDYNLMNDSHFTSMDFWEQGYTVDLNTPGIGWVANLLQHAPPDNNYSGTSAGQPIASAALLGNIQPGPLFKNPGNLCVNPKWSLRTETEDANIFNTVAYQALYATQQEVDNAAVINSFATAPLPAIGTATGDLPSSLAQQLYYVGELISGYTPTTQGGNAISGLDIPVFLIAHPGGFDTHANQVAVQAANLTEFAAAAADFRTTMITKGLWNNVLLVTYSEFGRTVEENSAAGTDHGQSGMNFILGGKVNGGVYGGQRSLVTDIVTGGNVKTPSGNLLPCTTDFHYLYAAIMQNWFLLRSSVSDAVFTISNQTPYDFVTGKAYSSLGPFANLLKA